MGNRSSNSDPVTTGRKLYYYVFQITKNFLFPNSFPSLFMIYPQISLAIVFESNTSSACLPVYL
jgi:hypothetical protein